MFQIAAAPLEAEAPTGRVAAHRSDADAPGHEDGAAAQLPVINREQLLRPP